MVNSFDTLKGAIVREASKADNTLAQPRFGMIEDYNPANNLVRCSFLPETDEDGNKIMTNWSLLLTHWAGPGYGDVAPLEPDNQIFLLPTYGHVGENLIAGGTFNKKIPMPKGPNDIGGGDEVTEVGERLLRSKSGTVVKFVNGNTLMIKADNEKHEVLHIITKGTDIHITCSDHLTADVSSQATVNCPNITLNGDVLITGNLHTEGEIKGDQDITDSQISMEGMRLIYNVHIHDPDENPPLMEMPS